MPHGRLTALGKQLRQVLATISRSQTAHACPATARRNTSYTQQPALHATDAPNGIANRTTARASAATNGEQLLNFNPISAADGLDPHESNKTSAADGSQSHEFNHVPAASRQRFRARHSRCKRGVDPIGSALRATGKAHLHFVRSTHMPNLHSRSRDPKRRIGSKNKRRRAAAGAVSLQSILGNFMKAGDWGVDPLSADWQTTYSPSIQEAEHLRVRGYDVQDVAAWAAIIGNEDVFEAANTLATRNRSSGVFATPLFVFLKLLRRPDILAGSLRVLLELAYTIFGERAKLLAYPRSDDDARFIAVVRLLRHARELWPASVPSIVQLYLRGPQLDRATETDSQLYRFAEVDTCKYLSTETYRLNKLMSLVSLSTSEQPFKNCDHQEAALIPILRYMSEYEPPLHIDRQGYRAVIRIQLAQRKTSDEQQWAGLQALSWPPWKEDRTGMDALITKHGHGTSRASKTLLRMREAGYRPLKWEQLAQIYAGWDVDGTPTIQTRARLEEPGLWLSKSSPNSIFESAQWAARIITTRTMQEAWACFLAWEGKQLPPSQDVFLAIAMKLREEARRPHLEHKRASQAAQQKAWPLFPGDVKELSPLPPSTHLETYTRTPPPPNLQDFYEDLREKGFRLRGYTLAYFIRHARTLPFGLALIRHSARQYPGLTHMISRQQTPELTKVPPVIYNAVVTLFSRFAYVPPLVDISSAPSSINETSSFVQDDLNHSSGMNHRSGIMHAIHLLRLRPASAVHMWDAVHQGLTRERNISFLETFPFDRTVPASSEHTAEDISEDLKRCGGIFQAFRLSRWICNLQARNGVKFSTSAFYSVCIVTEYRAAATWTVLQVAEANGHASEGQQSSVQFEKLVNAAKSLYITKVHCSKGKCQILASPHILFRQLVGLDDKPVESGADESRPPQLLTVPSPAVLHVYIRALGWLSRYLELHHLAQWMLKFRGELLVRRKQDRNGDEMMRRAIVALRVFLERSWLPGCKAGINYQVWDDGSALADTRKRLQAMQAPASDELIDSIKDIVEQVEEWGGWPSDDEVEWYSADQRFQSSREYYEKWKQKRIEKRTERLKWWQEKRNKKRNQESEV